MTTTNDNNVELIEDLMAAMRAYTRVEQRLQTGKMRDGDSQGLYITQSQIAAALDAYIDNRVRAVSTPPPQEPFATLEAFAMDKINEHGPKLEDGDTVSEWRRGATSMCLDLLAWIAEQKERANVNSA